MDIVTADNGTSYPKYKYILVTPFPSEDDQTLFKQILSMNISDNKLKDSLLELIQKDTNELATHTFTTFDKLSRGANIIDNIDNALFIVAIVSAPFTGGVSLTYIAISTAKKAVKYSTKKGFKYMAKKVLKKAVKYNTRKGFKFMPKKVVNKTQETIDTTSELFFIGNKLYIYYNYKNMDIKQICEER